MTWGALSAFFFFAGTLVVPVAEAVGVAGASRARLLYAPLCHQQVERSLSVAGRPQPVCARCAGIYAGGVAALTVAAFAVASRRTSPRVGRRLWLAAAAPTALDLCVRAVGFAGLDDPARFVVAVPLGFATAWFLAEGLFDLGSRRGSAAPVEALRG